MRLRTPSILLVAGLLVLSQFPTLATAGTISATNSTPGNFDSSSGNRSVTFTGAEAGFGNGTILDVNVSINFAKADGEGFDPPYPGGTPFYNEIHFRLTGPSATVVTLIAAGSFGAGSSGTSFDGTIVFDQAAALVVNNNVNQPSAGTFRPTGAGSLDDYNAQSATGVWTLFIEDTVGADSLRFRSVTVTIQTQDTVVPEPGTITLLGLGATGLIGYALRRRRLAASSR